MIFVQVDIKLQHEQVHEVVIGRATRHEAQHFIPFVNKLLDVSVLQGNFVKSCCVRHLFVFFIHGEKAVDHHKHLSACNVSLLRHALFGLGLLDLLSQEMGTSWDTPPSEL